MICVDAQWLSKKPHWTLVEKQDGFQFHNSIWTLPSHSSVLLSLYHFQVKICYIQSSIGFPQRLACYVALVLIIHRLGLCMHQRLGKEHCLQSHNQSALLILRELIGITFSFRSLLYLPLCRSTEADSFGSFSRDMV